MGGVLTRRGVVAAIAAVACAVLPAAVVSPTVASATPSAVVTLKVSPNTGLRTGDAVDVVAHNLPAGALVAALQCAPGAVSVFACLGGGTFGVSDSNGTFDGSLSVTRYPGVDCGKGGCFIGLAIEPGDGFVATRPIAFDTSTPALTLAVSPAQSLPFVAHVRVTGGHWPPGSLIELQECTADLQVCNFTMFDVALADAHGNLRSELFVRRQFDSGFGGIGGTIDCTTYAGGCALVAAVQDDSGVAEFLGAPIAFDPNAPIPPPPVLRVEPHSNLADHQIIEISGRRFTPRSIPSIATCFSSEHLVFCAGTSVEPIDAQGRLQPVFMAVRRVIGTLTTGAPGRRVGLVQQHRLALAAHFGTATERAILSRTRPIDCAQAAFHCFLEVTSDADGVIDQPLTFDPDKPPAPAPVITVTPTTKLKDRQLVHAAGHGFVPGSPVFAVECLQGGTLFGGGCDDFGALLGFADAQGRVAGDLAVHRTLTFLSGGVDCATTACYLRIGGDDDRIAPIRLQFDPGAPPAPPATIAVAPSQGLHDGQQVAVTGAAFPASSPVTVFECATDGQPNPTFLDILGCASTMPTAQTDSHGAFTTPLTVASQIPLFDGSIVDCAVSPDCVVVGASDVDPTAIALAPIAFAAGG